MKKSITALLLALALTLTACSNGGTAEQTTAPQSSAEESSQTSQTTQTEETSADTADEVSTDEETTPEETDAPQEKADFTFPDGSAGYYADGTKSEDGFFLQYDFAFMRYALPYYYDTDTTPDLYDFENYEFNKDMIDPELDYEYFKVQKGDQVGPFTVKDAWYKVIYPDPEVEADPYLFECIVELEGSMTVDGILYCAFEEEYAMSQGDMNFYPDPSSCENIPMPFNSRVYTICDVQGEKAYIMDTNYYRVGNVNDAGIQDYFDNGQYAKAKLTLKDPIISYTDQWGARCEAQITDSEYIG